MASQDPRPLRIFPDICLPLSPLTGKSFDQVSHKLKCFHAPEDLSRVAFQMSLDFHLVCWLLVNPHCKTENSVLLHFSPYHYGSPLHRPGFLLLPTKLSAKPIICFSILIFAVFVISCGILWNLTGWLPSLPPFPYLLNMPGVLQPQGKK